MWLNQKRKIGLIAIFAGGMILLVAMLIYVFTNGQPKTPVTCKQVTAVLSNLEYTPSDTTEAYLKQDSHLKNSVAVETDNIRFDFFEFDNDNSASNVYTHAYKQILNYRNGYVEDVETEEYYANYRLYSLKTTGMYYLTIWVDNTAIYAYCDEEYTGELGEILTAIGYQS